MNDFPSSNSTISMRFINRHELLLRDWQRFYQKQAPIPTEHNCDLPEFWAVAMLGELTYTEPDTAWLLILELIRQPLSDDAFGCLAVGPLKDLIEYHGPAVVERIEDEARSNRAFRRLLGGVWLASTPDVWARVERVRGAGRR